MTLGFAVTSSGTPDLVASMLSDAECLASTQYDSADNNIRECRDTIECDDEGDVCERRSDTYTEDGFTVSITFCSCEELDLDGEPTGVCHIYRKHKGSTTEAKCTDGTDCEEDEDCVKRSIPDVYPKVYQCKCVGNATPVQIGGN